MKETEKNKNSTSGMGVGATSILMVFVILCLVVFAMLSLVNANADKKLNDRLATRIRAYYSACDKAETLLEDMDGIMEQSAPYTLEDWRTRPWLRRTTASLLRLGAIWL